MSRDEFLNSSIRELFREFVVTKRRWEAERTRDIHLAYQCVRIYVMSIRHDSKGGMRLQLPDFRRLVAMPVRQQSPAQMEETLRLLSKQFGGRLREIPA